MNRRIAGFQCLELDGTGDCPELRITRCSTKHILGLTKMFQIKKSKSANLNHLQNKVTIKVAKYLEITKQIWWKLTIQDHHPWLNTNPPKHRENNRGPVRNCCLSILKMLICLIFHCFWMNDWACVCVPLLVQNKYFWRTVSDDHHWSAPNNR